MWREIDDVVDRNLRSDPGPQPAPNAIETAAPTEAEAGEGGESGEPSESATDAGEAGRGDADG